MTEYETISEFSQLEVSKKINDFKPIFMRIEKKDEQE